MKNLKELFEEEIKELYSTEEQLLEALPKMMKNAEDDELKKAFEKHIKETETHKERLEKIMEELDISKPKEKCKPIKTMIETAEKTMKEAEDDVKDAAIVGEAQHVEHFEISAYGTAVRYAKELGHKEIAKRLQKTLDEEYNADQKLTDIAEKRVNKKAMAEDA